jgi:hypothetical protein
MVLYLRAYDDVVMYRLSFFVLMVNPASDWVWMCNNSNLHLMKPKIFRL